MTLVRVRVCRERKRGELDMFSGLLSESMKGVVKRQKRMGSWNGCL